MQPTTLRALFAMSIFMLALTCALASPSPAHAQTMQGTTTVLSVFEADGSVQFNSPDGVWRLDYEAGIEANQAAKASLMRLAGTGKAISFTYFMEGDKRILTKASVAKIAWSK